MKCAVPLNKSHQRAAFDCGDAALNHYLQTTARQHQDKGISRTYVLVDEAQPERILAYMTLTVCEVLVEQLPPEWVKKYPNRIPAAKLARLAVSKDCQRQGYGAYLLVEAMQKTLDVNEAMGLAGLFVDAKHAAARQYYLQFGFLAAPDQLENLFMPLKAIRASLGR
ncbi:GNAT family N-acetyltransferase [Thiothrix subterranea]|uniref:GNAT family N-acetyltransferase n=1 Tax=Thiothrix subterranea TaxID=2735563 RepID=A0AA51MQW3_9GAMM|nr:GNAT family N-acetyltransferase [Thiothrix subterranea]MDQ5767506.1 GNAT family N-acetyltransferase [Thiothrix subterranea]WML88623.1 GNAT family N-acetyltransferase [Thiothrix subterranea]